MKRCTECGGALESAVTIEERAVAGRTFTAELPASRCKACDESYLDAKSLESFELAIARELATNGASTGEAFRFMRKALGYRAVDLGELLGVAPETISRWETGEREVDRGALLALGSLVLDRVDGQTKTIDRLEALKKPPRVAKVTRVEVKRVRRAG